MQSTWILRTNTNVSFTCSNYYDVIACTLFKAGLQLCQSVAVLLDLYTIMRAGCAGSYTTRLGASNVRTRVSVPNTCSLSSKPTEFVCQVVCFVLYTNDVTSDAILDVRDHTVFIGSIYVFCFWILQSIISLLVVHLIVFEKLLSDATRAKCIQQYESTALRTGVQNIWDVRTEFWRRSIINK